MAKCFSISNLKKRSCWMRVFLWDNLVNEVIMLLILGCGAYQSIIGNVVVGVAMIGLSCVLLSIIILLIVTAVDENRPCLWDPNFINKCSSNS